MSKLFNGITGFFAFCWYWLVVTDEEKRAAGVGNSREVEIYSIRPVNHAQLNTQSSVEIAPQKEAPESDYDVWDAAGQGQL